MSYPSALTFPSPDLYPGGSLTPDTAHPLTQLIYSALGSAMTAGDENTGWLLLYLVDACCFGAQSVYDVVWGREDRPGWSFVFDPNICPSAALPWLAQFPGVPLDLALGVDAARQRIINRVGWYRGTAATISALVYELTPPGAYVEIIERDSGDPQAIRVRVFASELTDDQQATLEAAVAAAIPAGDKFTFDAVIGASYADITAAHTGDPSYAGREAEFPTYQDIADYTP
jgi:hypothetical protein